MGHDISAKLPGAADDEIVAYIRRSARDPLNQVIYLALGVMDEAYGGVSGKGCKLEISREQLESAKDITAKKSWLELALPANRIFEMLARIHPAATVNEPPQNDGDVTRELEFIDDCLSAIDDSDSEHVLVYFG